MAEPKKRRVAPDALEPPKRGAERKALLLRLSPELHEELRKWAASDMRSLNAQIELLLRAAVKRRKA